MRPLAPPSIILSRPSCTGRITITTVKCWRPLLRVLDFHARNSAFKPVLEALAIVKRYMESGEGWYPDEATATIPIEGVIDSDWQQWIMDDESGQRRIKRVNYELCVLQTLRERLRHKQIWVTGADHYRNPDEDVPVDFADRRSFYYQMLHQTENVEDFIRTLKQIMTEALQRFNDNL